MSSSAGHFLFETITKSETYVQHHGIGTFYFSNSSSVSSKIKQPLNLFALTELSSFNRRA